MRYKTGELERLSSSCIRNVFNNSVPSTASETESFKIRELLKNKKFLGWKI